MKNNPHLLPKTITIIILIFYLIFLFSQELSNYKLPDDFLGENPIVNLNEIK
tara:strand:- start:59 stop:214 length:156 start_codon:yes stop_codon:yes gene_type:complete